MDYKYILDLANELIELNEELSLKDALLLATQIIIADSLKTLSQCSNPSTPNTNY